MADKQMKKVLTPEEVARLRTRAKLRFKSAVWYVINNLPWIREELEDRKPAKFSKQMFQIEDKSKFEFTYKLKYLLLTKLENRTPEIQAELLSMSANLPFFRGYPAEVREKLTVTSFYQYVGPNKILLQVGNVPLAAYCLIKGEVSKSHVEHDPVKRSPAERVYGVGKQGNIMGEMALLNNLPQKSKYKTLTPCDIIYVPTQVYLQIMKSTVKPTWDAITHELRKFPQFEDWSDIEMLLCARNSVMESYEISQTVFGDGYGYSGSVYFIINGYCQLIQDIDVDRINSKTSISYRLSKSQGPILLKKDVEQRKKVVVVDANNNYYRFGQSANAEIRDSSINASLLKYKSLKKKSDQEKEKSIRRETKFLQICTLRKGHIFNIGENLDHRRIVALKKSHCICVPRTWLLRRDPDNRWTRHRNFLEFMIPNDTELIFKQYYNDRKWGAYKNSLVNDLVQKQNKQVPTTIHDCPYEDRLYNGTEISLF